MEMPAPFIPRKAPRLVHTGASPSSHFRTNDAVPQPGHLPGSFPPQQQQQKQMLLDSTAVFSGEAESGLTCNAPASRKRAFLVDGNVGRTMLHLNLRRRLHVPREEVPAPVKSDTKAVAGACAEMTHPTLQASYDKFPFDDYAIASTSGRATAGAPVPAPTSPVISPPMGELVSQLYQQSLLEVDAFVRLQNECIRSGLQNAWKRHHRALLLAMEQGVLRRLREKDAELESASRRNAELEEMIRQLSSENQIWFNAARNNEAIVSSLRATLEQALLKNTAAAAGPAALSAPSHVWKEGCRESDCASQVFPADDAQSCCYNGASAAAAKVEHDMATAGELRMRSACGVCLKREAEVLLLPCRHLCLCRQCDPGVDACPVCKALKSASLQLIMC